MNLENYNLVNFQSRLNELDGVDKSMKMERRDERSKFKQCVCGVDSNLCGGGGGGGDVK